jgi:predicted transcriptional regulator
VTRELGDLQAEVMAFVWAREEVSVRDVHESLSRKRGLAYTTVMTVMSRLAEQKLLRRRRVGASYVYRAAVSREQFAGRAIVSALSKLSGGIGTPVLMQFVDAVEDQSPEQLDELARIIQEKRRRSRR